MAEIGNFTSVFQLGCALNGLLYIYTSRPHMEKQMAELFEKERFALLDANDRGVDIFKLRLQSKFIRRVDRRWDFMNRVISLTISLLCLLWLIEAGFHPHLEAKWYKLLIVMLVFLFATPVLCYFQQRFYRRWIEREIKTLERMNA